jgi:hypothetical protein
LELGFREGGRERWVECYRGHGFGKPIVINIRRGVEGGKTQRGEEEREAPD